MITIKEITCYNCGQIFEGREYSHVENLPHMCTYCHTEQDGTEAQFLDETDPKTVVSKLQKDNDAMKVALLYIYKNRHDADAIKCAFDALDMVGLEWE